MQTVWQQPSNQVAHLCFCVEAVWTPCSSFFLGIKCRSHNLTCLGYCIHSSQLQAYQSHNCSKHCCISHLTFPHELNGVGDLIVSIFKGFAVWTFNKSVYVPLGRRAAFQLQPCSHLIILENINKEALMFLFLLAATYTLVNAWSIAAARKWSYTHSFFISAHVYTCPKISDLKLFGIFQHFAYVNSTEWRIVCICGLMCMKVVLLQLTMTALKEKLHMHR